jgi:hypothetical protein
MKSTTLPKGVCAAIDSMPALEAYAYVSAYADMQYANTSGYPDYLRRYTEATLQGHFGKHVMALATVDKSYDIRSDRNVVTAGGVYVLTKADLIAFAVRVLDAR